MNREQALQAAYKKTEEAEYGSPLRYCLTARLPEYIRGYCPKKAEILDLGCGSGRYSPFFVQEGIEGSYTGVDLQPGDAGVSMTENFNVRLLQFDVHELDRLNEKFDFILSLMAFEHFSDDHKVIRHVAQSLREGAVAFIAVPSKASYLLYGTHGYRRYSEKSIAALADESGLELVEITPLCGAASYLFHLSWFVSATAIRLFFRAALYIVSGMDKNKSKGLWPRCHTYLDRMGDHHLDYGPGRRAHRFALHVCEKIDRWFPFPPSGYIAVMRRSGKVE